MSEVNDEIETRHKKELKSWDGEKRSAIKKAKATVGKGKKAKELLDSIEAEYESKLKQIQERHANERSEIASSVGEPNTNPNTVETEIPRDHGTEDAGLEVSMESGQEEEGRRRKVDKARQKREKAREKEREREAQIVIETANAGPSMRVIESEQILAKLLPLNLGIREVAADGHCLYRAVGAQCNKSYQDVRNLCADSLARNENDFGAFCEYDESVQNFAAYVNRVRSSAEWGGHLELRVLSLALRRPIYVYSAQSTEPLVMEEDGCDSDNPILLSYHLHYYSLGEHYNEVVPVRS